MPAPRTALLALVPPTLAAVALATVALAAPRPASACGGTFCDGGGPQVMAVDQRGESILFALDDGFVEAHVQIDYQGDPAQFAWVVPLPLPAGAEPEISVGSQALFDRLLAATVPTFTLSSSFEGDCSRGLGTGCASEDAGLSDGFGGSEEEPPGGPTVLIRDVAGAYEFAVLQGGTAEGVGQWLDDNGFARDEDAPEILQAYLDEDFSFVAFKLRSGVGVDQIHPVVLRYPGDEPCVPLRLTRIAAIEDMQVRAFFLGNARVVPTNYRHVELNPLRLRWLDVGTNNYEPLVREAVDLEGADGRAFVTEYAGTSAVVSRSDLRGFSWRSEAFVEVTSANLSETLEAQGLFGCFTVFDPQQFTEEERCGPSHPLLLPLLVTYFPPPPDVDPEEFYLCTTCYGLDESAWDPAGFAAALEEQVVGPAEHALDLLTAHSYLTRLYTVISPGEMTSDPLFHERPDLPDVSNAFDATRVFHCEDNDRVELDSGQTIYLDASDDLPDFSDMSAAVRIEEFPLAGAPVVLLDTAEADEARLADWNESHGPSGCECRAAGRRTPLSGWLGPLLLLGLRGRGRGRGRQRNANV